MKEEENDTVDNFNPFIEKSVASQAGDARLTPPGHLVSPLVSRGL